MEISSRSTSGSISFSLLGLIVVEAILSSQVNAGGGECAELREEVRKL
jgi:hypothetical protein